MAARVLMLMLMLLMMMVIIDAKGYDDGSYNDRICLQEYSTAKYCSSGSV